MLLGTLELLVEAETERMLLGSLEPSLPNSGLGDFSGSFIARPVLHESL